MDFDISATGPFWAALRVARLGEGDYAFKELQCPRCWKHDCAPSLPTGFMDRWMARHQRFPYDCRVCGKRFYHYKPAGAGE